MRSGFTLVELLVVITIIVILLSILMPAMDKALHEAEMTNCAANQRGAASGQIGYAMDYKRRYPYREVVRKMSNQAVDHRQLTVPMNRSQANQVNGYDERPLYLPYMSLASLECPKVDDLDLASGSAAETYIYGSITRFAGWQYHFNHTTQGQNTTSPLTPGTPGPGMLKLGDRWTFGTIRSRILGGDHYRVIGVFGWTVEAAHPDVHGLTSLQTFQEASAPNQGLGDADAKKTISIWTLFTAAAQDNVKGIDVNYHYDDGAVERFNALGWWPTRSPAPPPQKVDDRCRRVPGWNDLHLAGALIVPNNR
jgi:prepilin-type N-terminal cleavage/methylation domain-containing protein